MNKKILYVVAGLVGLVVIAVAAVVLMSSEWWGGFNAATVLPDDTIVYFRVSDLPEVWERLDEKGTTEKFREFFQENAELTEEEVAEYEAMLRRVRSVHYSFHGLRKRKYGAAPKLLFIADIGADTPLDEFLPKHATDKLTQATEHNGVQLYEMKEKTRRKSDLTALFASSHGKVLMASDKGTLEDVLDALADGRRDSLAKNDDFQRVTGGAGGRDCTVYVSVRRALDLAKTQMPPRLRQMVEPAWKSLGVGGIECLAVSGDIGAKTASARVLMDPESAIYELIAQPATERKVVDYLPETTLACVAVGVGDGKAALRSLKEAMSDVVRKALSAQGPPGARPGRGLDVDEELKQIERQFGIDLEDAAGLVKEVGVFVGDRPGLNTVAAFVQVTDDAEAERMLERVTKKLTGGRDTVRKHKGVAIHTAGPIAWAMLDDYVFLGGETALEAVGAAHESGKTLAETDAYREVADLLPSRSSHFVYVSPDRALELMPKPLRRDGGLEALRDLAEGLAVAAAVKADDGLVEITLAQSKELHVADIAEPLLTALGKARQEASKVRSKVNAKQIAHGTLLWMMKQGDNSLYPPSLKALYESGIIADPKVFLHPRNASKASKDKFASDYNSILDLAGFSLTEASVPVSITPLAWEKKSFYKDGGRVVAFFDSHVEYVEKDRFQKLLLQAERTVAEAKRGR